MVRRPIECAPRDGTFIILFGGKTDEDDYGMNQKEVDVSRPVVGFWTQDVCEESCEDRNTDWWAFAFWDGGWRSGCDNPTHWTALD